MCRVTAVLVSVLLLLASFLGPFFHRHEAHRHTRALTGQDADSVWIHTHLAIHFAADAKKGEPAIDSEHEGMQGEYVSFCVFEQESSVFMPFVGKWGFVEETFIESSEFVVAPPPQAHDPPSVDSVSARAPPA